MRGWDQSERFDVAWALVAATYQRDVHVLANAIDITPKHEKRPANPRSRRHDESCTHAQRTVGTASVR
jgi:hypothetical protein